MQATRAVTGRGSRIDAGDAGGWNVPPERVYLAADEIHVWLASLEQPDAQMRDLAALLDSAERERAARYRFERDRRRFIAAHGIQRAILGAYLGVPATEIAFAYGPDGKPFLASRAEHILAPHFSVSHSETCFLVALARGREVGVDIEFMRPLGDIEAVARTAFSPHERSVLETLDGQLRHDAFYACWTRKEAYIKGIGQGLSCPLDSFDVSLAPDEPARLLTARGMLAEATRWHYYQLPPIPGYAMALAVESDALSVRCWRWAGRTWSHHQPRTDLPGSLG